MFLYGEHAREVISDELCLFLVKLLTNDIQSIDQEETGNPIWEGKDYHHVNSS